MSDYAASAIEGGTSLLNNLMNNLFAGHRAKKQYKYDKKLMELQNQMNIDMWNMQNEYNSPAAQMQRFQEAGLNPNLMYGNVNSGNATSAPEAMVASKQAPQFEVKGMQNIASTILQERALKNQEEVNQAKINLLRQQAISESMSQTSRLINDFNNQLEAYRRTGDLKMFWDTYEDKKRAIGLQNENLLAQTALSSATRERTEAESKISKYNLDVMLPLQKEHAQKQISKLDNEITSTKLQNDLLEQKMPFELNIVNNLANESGEKVKLVQKQLEKAKEELQSIIANTNLTTAEAIVMYINSLPDVRAGERFDSQTALKKFIEEKYKIKL